MGSQTIDAAPDLTVPQRSGGAAETVASKPSYSLAILVPCYNEAITIGQVVQDFKSALPIAKVYVYDNNSADRTREVASAAGAIVRSEPRQGKGNVVRRMFADIEADIYVLVDGDATYDPNSAPEMIRLLVTEGLDMVVGCRRDKAKGAYRQGHRLGNAILTAFLAWMFGRAFTDTLSGFRVFSRRFVKTFPSLSSGFEIETEINVHALALQMPVGEVLTRYDERPPGSSSKLSTYRDGLRILGLMFNLFRQEKPGQLFSSLSAALGLIAFVLFIPLAITFAHTHLVPRFPTAILCTGLIILAMLSMACGLILDTVTRGRRELRRLAYLSLAGPLA